MSRNSGRNARRGGGIKPLHVKGLLVLALVFLAESVTVTNAVNEWNAFVRIRHLYGGFYRRFVNNDNNDSFSPPPRNGAAAMAPAGETKSPTSSTCPTSSPVVARTIGRILPRRRRGGGGIIVDGASAPATSSYTDECCTEKCSHCMSPKELARVCRGGHVVDHSAAASGAADGILGLSSKTPYGIPLHLWKVIFQAILTTINVLCWLIPLQSKHISENKLGLSLANAFSGGVFMSLAFGHLIPECVHGFEEYPEAAPYLLVLVGYLLIFFVEKVAFDAHDILHEMEHQSEKKQTSSSSPSSNGAAAATAAAQPSSGRSAVILLGALAVHSILEMMALGLSNSFGDSALLTLSIALHQPAESIALLVAFLKSGMPKPQILQFLSIFSCMGPIGVALGMAVNEFAAPIVDSVMLAIVAGTFVYVGATEVSIVAKNMPRKTHNAPN